MTLYMETTQIAAESTVGEIQGVLSRYGATAILIENDPQTREVKAVSFKVPVNGQEVPFRLPCRWEAIEKMMLRRIRIRRNGKDYAAQAKRVAWRQILRWIQAQMALVETSMVTMEEVFLPYAQLGSKTLFETIKERGFALLEHKP